MKKFFLVVIFLFIEEGFKLSLHAMEGKQIILSAIRDEEQKITNEILELEKKISMPKNYSQEEILEFESLIENLEKRSKSQFKILEETKFKIINTFQKETKQLKK